MRYYDITIGELHYTSRDGSGANNPEALNVELDITSAAKDVTFQGSTLRVWGIGLPDISQSRNLFGKDVKVLAGMGPGLPLANPAQAGWIGGGTVYQAFGNWVGVDQTLDIVISSSSPPPSAGGPSTVPAPRNLVLNWKKNQDLTGPLQQALQQAFPDHTVVMRIASSLKPPSDQVHFSGGIEQFGTYLRRYTQMLAGANAPGVSILFSENKTITVVDGTQSQTGGVIDYQDLVGQPTWIGVDTISIRTVMRGDLHVGDTVTLPRTLVTNTAGAGHYVSGQMSPQNSLTFQGSFRINQLRHVGNFRQPDASAWCTNIEAVTVSGGA